MELVERKSTGRYPCLKSIKLKAVIDNHSRERQKQLSSIAKEAGVELEIFASGPSSNRLSTFHNILMYSCNQKSGCNTRHHASSRNIPPFSAIALLTSVGRVLKFTALDGVRCAIKLPQHAVFQCTILSVLRLE